MTMRTLYRYLVHLHPPAFRREFAAEMIWIFDEAAESLMPDVAYFHRDDYPRARRLSSYA